MATIQKRGRSWRAQVRRNGQKFSGTFDTRAEAKAWAIVKESEVIRKVAELPAGETAAADNSEIEVRLPSIAPSNVGEGATVADAFRRYAKEVSVKKRGRRWETVRFNSLIRDYPVFQRPIVSITAPDIADWRDHRLMCVAPATVNRDLCLISSVFTLAMKEWRMGLTVNPCSLVTKPRKSRPRTQRISQNERERIIEKLGWDGSSRPEKPGQWVGFAFYLALETAMRKGEILSLQWRNIDFEARYAHLEITKNGDERYVPLSQAAIALLKIVKDREPEARVVPIESAYFCSLFIDAKRDAGLAHIHFHDSRREAATTMAPKLTNVLELAAITGHKSLAMLQVYYKPKPSELAAKLDL
ncbi:MAG: site-specific integrase [Sphingomonadales bacterium]|nr:MAG: site-specific integrase [Sphingomonadales bacterium]